MNNTSSYSNHCFYYLLKGTLYRSQNNPEDLIEINQEFKNNDLIEARKRVFEVYQNTIDVLLQSKGENYKSHDQARITLTNFIKKNHVNFIEIRTKLNSFYDKFDIEIDFDKGLSVYLVQSNTKTFTTLEGQVIYEDKLLLHDLNSEIKGLKESMYNALLTEYKLFQKFGYDCKDCIITMPKKNNLETKDTNYVLSTPINYNYENLLKNL
ncbi:hypothetical protein SAMN05444143_102175 [Flavobacterium succinicans]|uniref:Uncharacterized protein n=1 Tax=Flavobacterium succinicans TaxID=29536 RepID=A0A1I4TLI4_9FLAO|nr:hypothetical protein [Flavobacterium succinicans]SFM77594.1 hypothetical protein SAMN05444143_102175 [Flavobacterium succinicans]